MDSEIKKYIPNKWLNWFQVGVPSTNTIPGLHALRAISLSVIIFSHLQFTGFIQHKVNLFLQIYGQTALSAFFVISGFIITKLFLIEEEKYSTISLRKFYVRRILRIFPAYYFLLFVYMILQLAGQLNLSGISWLTSLTFTKQFCWKTDWETAHLWSLSVEEVFYLFWPFVFLYLKKFRVKIALAFILSVVILRMVQSPAVVKQSLTIFHHGDTLMIGCLFAIYYDKIASFVLKGNMLLNLVLLLTVLFLFVSLPKTYHAMLGERATSVINSLFSGYGVLSNLVTAYIMINLINLKGLGFKILNNSIMTYLSRFSYGFYLWQQLFISFRPEFHRFSIPVILLFVFIAANLSYIFIEKPLTDYKIKFK